MAGQIATKTFSGGMNKDLDFSLVKDNQYYDAQNYKLIADENSNGFILENAEGNNIWLDLSTVLDTDGATPIGVTSYIVGHCYIQPYLVLFITTNNVDRSPDSGDTSRIVRITVDKDELQQAVTIYKDGISSTKLDFTTTFPISAVGHYEADNIVKVYWTDNYNNVRWMNIMDDSLTTYTADMFDITPDFPVATTSSVRPFFNSYVPGNIHCSSIQYAYQYYIPNGATTVYSPASKIIQIPKTDSRSSERVAGGELDENSGYGVSLDIEIPAVNKFTKIRLVCIQYETFGGIPTVRVFSEKDITASAAYTLNIIDTGQTLTQIVYDDYLIQTNTTFVAKNLTIKDNYLFAGNIKETYYDVDIDCRAYRFDATPTPQAVIYESDLSTYYTIEDDGSWVHSVEGTGSNWSIPETADCINLYNKSNYSSTDDENSNVNIFQLDGVTKGATGPNIKFAFNVDDNDIIDSYGATDDLRWLSGGSMYIPGERSFQRNEVYRLGIIFRNAKMQPSPVKWSCDLKTPSFHEDSGTAWNITELDGSDVIRQRLGIATYYIGDGTGGSTTWASTGATSWELVMVPRTSADRSILGQGLLQKTHNYNNGVDDYNFPVHHMNHEDYTFAIADTTDSQTVMRFISPEVAFNKNLEFKENDFLHYIGYFDHTNASNRSSITGCHFDKVSVHTGAGDHTATSKDLLTAAKYVGYTTSNDTTISVDGTSYKPFCERLESTTNIASGLIVAGSVYGVYNTDSSYVTYDSVDYYTHDTFLGIAGTDTYTESGTSTVYAVNNTGATTSHMAIAFDDATPWDADTGVSDRVAIVNYKRDVFLSQYGGIDYYARQNNQYISISDPNIDNASAFKITHEGDTFIDWFFYNNVCLDLTANNYDSTEGSVFIFPVETSISLSHRLDGGLHREVSNLNARMVQEISGTWEGNIVDASDRAWTQDTALYQYNPIYSQISNSEFHFADTVVFESEKLYPTRIKRSELKINGELSDSFTTFLPNNFIDLNGQYGPLNNLDIFKNNLYFWQTSGFGVASVNTRALIQSNTPGILALGTGGVLDRIDYLSETIGNQNQFGIAKSNTGLYWVDNNKNEFFKFAGDLKSVSKLGGIQTWINSTGRIGDVKAVYDHKYNDVIFTMTFARVLVESSLLTNYVRYSTMVPYGLNIGNSPYNAILNARFSNTINPSRIVLTHQAGTGENATWGTTPMPYGTTDSQFYVTIDKDSNMTYTITFNEIVDAFTSFNSFIPGRYIELGTNFLSTNDYQDLYKHNDDDAIRCLYYGVYKDSEVTMVFNKDFPYSKVWDSLKWHSESVDSDNINQFTDTFNTVTIYNDYQHTGARDIVYNATPTVGETEVTRRERTWSMQIPRNIVAVDVSSNPDITDVANHDETQTFKERIRDKYIVVNFTYDNDVDNYVFSVPFVSAVYRKSSR